MGLGPDPVPVASPRTLAGRRLAPRAVPAASRWTPWQNLASFGRRAPRTGESERAAIEEFNRGVTLAAIGDADAAVGAYRRAVASATGHIAAKASFNIAVLLGDDLVPAAAAYRVAIETGHEDVAPRAAFNLGLLLERHGALADAEKAFARALEFGHEEVTRDAALRLGQLRGAGQAARSSGSVAVRRLPRGWTRRRRGYRPVWLAASSRFSGVGRARGHAC